MGAYNTLKVIHILSIATWLGVDLGVFACSSIARSRTLSAEARGQFLSLLGRLDLGPRVSLIATIPLGLSLAHLSWGVAPGFGAVTGWIVALLCVGWALLVVRQHHGLGRLARPFMIVDTTVRVGLVVALAATSIASFAHGPDGGPVPALWLRWKVLLFAGMIACGLWIRFAMRDAGPLFGAMLKADATEVDFEPVDRMIRSLYPPVFAIWLGIVVCILLATTKPF